MCGKAEGLGCYAGFPDGVHDALRRLPAGAVVNQDGGPVLGEAPGDSRADAPGPSGDEREFVCEREGRHDLGQVPVGGWGQALIRSNKPPCTTPRMEAPEIAPVL